MAKFVFRLQSVLTLKSRLEEQQRNAFATARRRVDEEEEKLNNLYGRLSFYEDEGRRMLTEDSLHVRDIIDNEHAINTVKDYIEDQKLAVQKAEELLEIERLKLVDAMKERRTYERLREKAYDDYLEEEKRAEGIVNDEHNSYVYGMMKES